jgi:hypothetical protein
MLEAMIYLISRTVPEDLQPAVVVLAFAELPLDWTEILGRTPDEITGMLAEFFMRDDFAEVSGLSGGCTAGAREAWARKQAEQTWALYCPQDGGQLPR